MNVQAPYDPNNVIARIVRGEQPCAKVHEDEVALAFLDVFPQSRGHTLVVPKRAGIRILLDMPPSELGSFMIVVQRVAARLVARLEPDGLSLHQYNGAQSGQTVFHLHVHLVPHYRGVQVHRHGEAPLGDTTELKRLADRLRS